MGVARQAGPVRQQFRVSGKRRAGGRHRLLVDGGRHQRGTFSAFDRVQGSIDGGQCDAPIIGGDASELNAPRSADVDET